MPVNIEADVSVGRILKRLAAGAGVLYTVSSGDEPGCQAELWEFVTTLGCEPMVIGKGKNNPLCNPLQPSTFNLSPSMEVYHANWCFHRLVQEPAL